MRIRVECRTHAEFDACISAGNIAVIFGLRVVAWGNASVVARENASVEAWGNASVEAWGNASVVARENASVEAWGNASVVARENASVEAWGNASVVARENASVEAWGNASVVARENASVVARENASVEARGNASVEARGNASVVAWGNASVEAWGNASVEARENVLVRLFSALKVKASAYVAIYMHGKAKSISGGRRLKCAPFPKTAAAWAEFHGVEVKRGHAIVYKGVDADYSTDHARRAGLTYKIGETVVAPDWDGGKQECGNGLHFSPRPVMTLEFNSSAKRFLACRIKLTEMRKPDQGDTYPHKIKAKQCEVLAEVDRHGRPVA